MRQYTPWPEEHLEILRKAITELEMPFPDLERLFPGRTSRSIRNCINRLGLSVPQPKAPPPDMSFLEEYIRNKQALKEV